MEKNLNINYPIIKKEKNNYLILAYSKDEYLKAKKFVGISNLSHYDKILISGENALELINHFSGCNILSKKENCFTTVFFNKKNFLGEGYVVKISEHRFIIIMKKCKKLYKSLKKKRKSFTYTIINNVTLDYSFFSFHGDFATTYFKNITDKHLYQVNHQGYLYYIMLTYKKDEKNILSHFSNQNFILLGLFNQKIFLQDNNVINDFSRLTKKNIFKLLPTIYKLDNPSIKPKKKKMIVEKYELQGNILLDKSLKIFNNQRKVIGRIYDSYYLPFKANPLILSIINPDKLSKIAIIKNGKKEFLMKKVFFDETQ